MARGTPDRRWPVGAPHPPRRGGMRRAGLPSLQMHRRGCVLAITSVGDVTAAEARRWRSSSPGRRRSSGSAGSRRSVGCPAVVSRADRRRISAITITASSATAPRSVNATATCTGWRISSSGLSTPGARSTASPGCRRRSLPRSSSCCSVEARTVRQGCLATRSRLSASSSSGWASTGSQHLYRRCAVTMLRWRDASRFGRAYTRSRSEISVVAGATGFDMSRSPSAPSSVSWRGFRYRRYRRGACVRVQQWEWH